MKLLKCHIENFGVLSDFDLDFSAGLTVIYRKNGFGKSTLAAFIKAMFYGMPRGGSRSITGNERKRYDPWQGGKYGGFLEFEYQGIRYRVTRYFGKTATKDSFSIMDLSNRQSNTPFSEKLGEELFQLDADSFARSTYMPQLSSRDMEATTSIRTKLSNLVDNTNDLNNFDTATEALRRVRSKFRAYRGTGGLIGDLERDYNTLDRQKYEAEKKKPRLQEVSEEIEHLNWERKQKVKEISGLREKIRAASEQKALLMRYDQFQDLRNAVEKQEHSLQELNARYPTGYPTPEEIRVQRENLGILQQSAQRLQEIVLSEEDRGIVAKEEVIFCDPDTVSKEIDSCDQWCQELAEVSARLTSQMLLEELECLENLSVQFEKGVPAEADLQDCLKAADEMNAAQIHLSTLTMSAENQTSLDQLKELFQDGVPDEATLSACEQSQRSQEVLGKRRELCALSHKEQEDFQSLQRTFASGVPSEQEIQDRQNDCRRIVELTSIKNTQTTHIQQEDTPDQADSKAPFVWGGVGALLLILGIVCFVLNLSIPGILLLVTGFVGLLAAFWLHTRQMVGGKVKNTSVITGSAITDAENQELYDLKRALNDFLLRFYPDVAEPEDKLVLLLLDMKKFEELQKKKQALETEQQQIDEEIEKNTRILREVFERYYYGKPYRDAFVQELRESCRSYAALNSQMERMLQERSELSEKIEKYRTQIIRLLHVYYPVELPADLRQGVRTLASDAAAFAELSHKKQTMLRDNAEYQARAVELTKQIQTMLTNYRAFDPQSSFGQCLQGLRKRLETYKVASVRMKNFLQDHKQALEQKEKAEQSLHEFLEKYRLSGDSPINQINGADDDIRKRMNMETNLQEAKEKLQDFLIKNPGIEQQQIANIEELPAPEVLQAAEKEVQEKVDAMENCLHELRQERDSLRRIVENIPAWDDQMAHMKEEQQSAEKKCALLDRTMELLNQAKDNLSNSYVGEVERGFKEYASSLLEQELGHVMVDKDLKLYIDEQGAAREVGSFSAGMVDSILLCMRLSLVDALFTKEKPFLILDDPFVNLDDDHTKRALEILEKISQNHQILYLVCNRSRSWEHPSSNPGGFVQ